MEENVITGIRERLFEMQDKGYRDFQAGLMPTVPKDRIIGVRTPELRKYARELRKSENLESFMKDLPHVYYEENNLHGFLIEQIRGYEACVEALDCFLPYVDNWATCDCCTPKVLKKHLPEFEKKIEEWMASGHTYTIRYGIRMLMCFYLDEAFRPDFLDRVVAVKSEEYYVKMMVAWYFATALAKQYEVTLPYMEEKKLAPWTHNKAIQKAVESYRITKEQKCYLKTCKIR